jgi:hypothetical protein
MTRLTPMQQSFLDNYVRKHSILGKKKTSDANKYVTRKAKVEESLAALPEFSQSRLDLQAKLDEADRTADKGEFKSAHKQLDKVQAAAQKAQADYNPDADIQQTVRMIGGLVASARGALPQMADLQNWRQAKSESAAPATDKVASFLATANDRVESIHARIHELERVSRNPEQRRTIINLRKDCWSKVLAPDLAPLKSKPDTFLTSGNLKSLITIQSSGAEQVRAEQQRDEILKTGTQERSRPVRNQFVMKQAIEGIAYMHDQNMLHNDIKPGNMMMMSDGTLRIVDFGEGVAAKDSLGTIDKESVIGTPGYEDPEIFDPSKPNSSLKADNYSLGQTADVLHSQEENARAGFAFLQFDNTT